MPPPSAGILVLNYNGRDHLAACLPSLAALDYAAYTVTVVDNGSTDGSLDLLRTSYPDVAVLPLGRNRGFAPAYNTAIRQCREEIAVLLNNDTRVDPGWLAALVETMDRHQAAAAASLMLDWDGQRIDFAGGLPTFLGHAWQLDHGRLPTGDYPERRLLFGCAGSLAVRRDAFLHAGGFDDDYFVYFEDVDLGWRMNLVGYDTVLAPRAVTCHRLHGTASGWGHTHRLRLYERNALFTVFKNYGDEALARIWPAAITLTLARALAHERFDAGAIQFGQIAPDRLPLPPPVVATLLALEDVARALPALVQKRRLVQARRTRSDDDLFALFPDPLKLHDIGCEYEHAARALIRDLHIDELFGLAASPRVAITTASTPGEDRRATVHPQAAGTPLVSVIVLTASGGRHLPDCLTSLRQHTWPADRTEVIVVDNGSTEDPTDVARRCYPGVKVVRTGANLGFSGGNNAGARAATGDWIVFLNDDTAVEPRWLDEMIAVADRRGAASVAAFLVDWSGTSVDFAGGLVNLEGRGFSIGHGLPVSEVDPVERPVLFACGAAVMVRRDVFEAAEGWDEPTFAYYEDVEFGWRLWMLGHEVWFAPRAIVRHRHHGTSGQVNAARARAFERNALRMLYCLLEEDNLRRVLPAAVLLAADRALLGTPFSRVSEAVHSRASSLARRLHPHVLKVRLLHALSQRGARRQLGWLTSLARVGPAGLVGAARDVLREVSAGWESPEGRTAYLIEATRPSASLEAHVEWVPAEVFAQLAGLADFITMLPEMSERRARLQVKRKRTDADILERFGAYWWQAVPSPHLDRHLALREPLLAALQVPRAPASHVLAETGQVRRSS